MFDLKSYINDWAVYSFLSKGWGEILNPKRELHNLCIKLFVFN